MYETLSRVFSFTLFPLFFLVFLSAPSISAPLLLPEWIEELQDVPLAGSWQEVICFDTFLLFGVLGWFLHMYCFSQKAWKKRQNLWLRFCLSSDVFLKKNLKMQKLFFPKKTSQSLMDPLF